MSLTLTPKALSSTMPKRPMPALTSALARARRRSTAPPTSMRFFGAVFFAAVFFGAVFLAIFAAVFLVVVFVAVLFGRVFFAAVFLVVVFFVAISKA